MEKPTNSQILINTKLHMKFKARVFEYAMQTSRRINMKDIAERLIEKWIENPNLLNGGVKEQLHKSQG